MKEVIGRIIRMDEQGRLGTICGIDTLIRIDERGVSNCSNCTFNDIGAKLLVCPYRSLIKEEIK